MPVLLYKQEHEYEKFTESKTELERHFAGYLKPSQSIYNKEFNVSKRIVCDFIAGMTDNYALNAYKQIKMPKPTKFK